MGESLFSGAVRRVAGRWLPHVAIFALVAAAYLFGHLEFLELRLMDARFSLLEREAKGQLVVVEIDPKSLQELRTWPWARSVHARLTERLREAGARHIAFDVDFGSPSDPEGDRAFAEVLAATGPAVVLPVFQQITTSVDGSSTVYLSVPLEQFAEHTSLASINVRPERDGLIRRMSVVEPWGDAFIPSLAAFLAGDAFATAGDFYIDYSIAPRSIPRLSYVDVLQGRFDPAAVAGKNVIIGATAIELSDIVATPNSRALPGPIVHALSYESLVQGRALQRFGPEPILVIGFLLALLSGPLLVRKSWYGGLFGLVFITAGTSGVALGAQANFPLTLDTTPWMLSAVLSYAYGLGSRIRQLDLRLMVQSLNLKRRDALMKQVAAHTFDAIVTVDGAGNIRSFNRAAEQIFQILEADAVGRPVRSLLPSELTEQDAALVFGSVGGPYDLVGRRRHSESFPMEVVVSRVDLEEEIFIALVRDLSTQKMAEARAAKASNYLRESIESISDGFALYGPDERLILCNEKYREIIGGDRDLIKPGTRHQDVIRSLVVSGRVPEIETDERKWIRESKRRHHDPGAAYEMCLDDGTWLRVSKNKTFDGGVLGIYTDITEQKIREDGLRAAKNEADAANRSKTDFLHNMSHELRTPLNAIIGFSEIMEKELLGPLGTSLYIEYAADIHKSGDHLLSIINDILDLAKIEAGKYELEETEVDLAEVIDLSCRLVEDRAEQSGHTLSVKVSEDLLGLHADERALKQILLNLLSNAVKFTPDGGEITVTAGIAGDGCAELSVTDTGIGIAEENIETVLSNFGQVDTGLSREYEGTGLGLPLVKWLAKLHGGTLRIESKVDAGTTVTVTFPAERVRRRTSVVAFTPVERAVASG
ncbi:MAG: CHASE2 domain-containing protein [Proteobacteria bacterium]|nr:CHASE2 domain-containing protein [Pseudomonadota bacterium]